MHMCVCVHECIPLVCGAFCVCVCVCVCMRDIRTFLHLWCSIESRSHHLIAAQSLVPLCQGFGHIDEVAQVMYQLLKPLVLGFEPHAPEVGYWATPEILFVVRICKHN